jgi:dipeptidyl aminopeptidase/acylaminoacyl peptidase
MELFRAAPGATIDDIALSPDGQQVALTLLEKQERSSVLKLLPVAGGEASELVRAKDPEVIVGDSLSWSSDSRYIVFGRAQTTSQELQGSFPSGRKTQLFSSLRVAENLTR